MESSQLLPRKSSSSQLNTWIYGSLIFLLIYAGFTIRILELDHINSIRMDEISWLSPGVSLLKTGTPENWSMFDYKYKNQTKKYFDGLKMTMITPFLDHPPAFSLLMGSWLKATHQSYYNTLNWKILRLPMIISYLLTAMVLVMLIARLQNRQIAVWCLAGFCFLPAACINARQIAVENIFPLLLLINLYCFSRINDQKNLTLTSSFPWIVLLLINVLAPLMKLTGVVIPCSIILLGILFKNYRLAIYSGLSLLCSITCLLLYVAAQDFNQFITIMDMHHARPQSLMHFWSIFSNYIIRYMNVRDPGMIVGVIGLCLFFSYQSKQKLLLLVPLILQILSMSYVAPHEYYQWYSFTLYPFIGMGLGYLLFIAFRGNFLATCILSTLILGYLELTDYLKILKLESQTTVMILSFVLIIMMILRFQFKLKRIYQLYIIVLTLGLFYLQYTLSIKLIA